MDFAVHEISRPNSEETMINRQRLLILLALIPLAASLTQCEGHSTCDVPTCMIGKHNCTEAKCMTSSFTGDPVCEFRPTFTGACRCHLGERRFCPAIGIYKVCVSAGTNETKWSLNCP